MQIIILNSLLSYPQWIVHPQKSAHHPKKILGQTQWYPLRERNMERLRVIHAEIQPITQFIPCAATNAVRANTRQTESRILSIFGLTNLFTVLLVKIHGHAPKVLSARVVTPTFWQRLDHTQIEGRVCYTIRSHGETFTARLAGVRVFFTRKCSSW